MERLLLDTKEKLIVAIEELIDIEPVFGDIYKQTGLPPLRMNPEGFAAMFRSIISQQLSVNVATTIRERLIHAGLNTPVAISAVSDEVLRNHGVSKQKIRYLRSLIEADIDYDALHDADDTDVIKSLTSVTGVGNWTAEVYLLFSLHRSDAFAHNDHGLKVATQKAFALEALPTERQMKKIASAWSPQRSAACYLLWAYYKIIKGHDAI